MRETEILVEQQPPRGVLVCEHAGLVINTFSLQGRRGALTRVFTWNTDTSGRSAESDTHVFTHGVRGKRESSLLTAYRSESTLSS